VPSCDSYHTADRNSNSTVDRDGYHTADPNSIVDRDNTATRSGTAGIFDRTRDRHSTAPYPRPPQHSTVSATATAQHRIRDRHHTAPRLVLPSL
jgi:hypothetical protein